MTQIETRADFDNRRVVIFNTDTETEQTAPAVIMYDVEVVPDSEGAIVMGSLGETVPGGFVPRQPIFRKAIFTRSGAMVDRLNQRPVRLAKAMIVKAGTCYYVEA